MVAITSVRRLAGRLRIAGDVQKIASFAAGFGRHSPVRQVGHPYQAGARECARLARSKKMPTFDQFPDRSAMVNVIAGLIWAPGLPKAWL